MLLIETLVFSVGTILSGNSRIISHGFIGKPLLSEIHAEWMFYVGLIPLPSHHFQPSSSEL